jgi:hypothetical protein
VRIRELEEELKSSQAAMFVPIGSEDEEQGRSLGGLMTDGGLSVHSVITFLDISMASLSRMFFRERNWRRMFMGYFLAVHVFFLLLWLKWVIFR